MYIHIMLSKWHKFFDCFVINVCFPYLLCYDNYVLIHKI